MKILELPLWNFFKGIWKSQFSSLDFDNEAYGVSVFLFILCLAAAGLLTWLIYIGIYSYFDKRSSTKETLSGELIDKRYVGKQSSTGTGTAIIPNTSSGVGIGLVSTSSHSDEEFLFFVKANKIYKMECDMQQFYVSKIGDKVKFEVTTGGMSKDELNVELV